MNQQSDMRRCNQCVKGARYIVPINQIPPQGEKLQVDGVAYVEIPYGFVLSGNDYQLYLNVNETNLSMNRIWDIVNPSTTGLQRPRPREVITVDGDISVNIVLDGFRPCATSAEISLAPVTAFSYSENIPVWKTLAISMNGYNQYINFRLDAEIMNTYIIDAVGRTISKKTNTNAFYRTLNDPSIKRMAMVSYRILIIPYIENSAKSQC